MKTLLICDRDYLPTVMAILNSASATVDLLAFSFAIGSAGGRINFKGSPLQIAEKIKALKNEHGPDLHVRLYTEGIRETVDRNRITAEYLKKAEVEIKYGSTHAKGFCIDRRYTLFGSTNLTEQSIAKNNEANVLIDDVGIAKEFTRYFDHLWSGGGHGEIKLKPPLLADGDFKDVLIRMIDGARRCLEFSIYFFNHPAIEKAFVRAHVRGVKITGFVHQHDSFALPYIHANRSTIRRLRKAGMKKLFFSVPSTFSHSKYLVRDREEVLLGTGNWLVQDVTTHPQLYINLSDKKLAQGLSRHLASQIKTQSTRD